MLDKKYALKSDLDNTNERIDSLEQLGIEKEIRHIKYWQV